DQADVRRVSEVPAGEHQQIRVAHPDQSSPISSFHTSGFAAIQSPSIVMQRSSARSTTLTPFSRSQSMPPSKFTDSPTTTVPMLNCRTRPLQYQQGARVVTMMVSL